MPIARTRVATARPMSPYPTIPTVWPEIAGMSNCSHRAGLLVADHAAEVFGEIQDRTQGEFAERQAEDAAAIGQRDRGFDDFRRQHVVQSGSTGVDPAYAGTHVEHIPQQRRRPATS